jgi:uncharacterized protein (DUF305 family)
MKGGNPMARPDKALLYLGIAIAAIVMGVGSTLLLASWSQAYPFASASWADDPVGSDVGPMGWGAGPMGVVGEFDYLDQMVAHHQEAVDAARQLERSHRPEMRALGNSIVTTQSAEITRMNGWLAQWYPGPTNPARYRPMMRDLSGLTADALDEAFLRDMIPHHMFAVMMSQQLLTHGRIQHDEVADFARTVRDSQHAEIVGMRRYLTDWFASPDQSRYRTGFADGAALCGREGSWGPAGMMDW